MKTNNLFFAALIISVSISGCGKAEDAIEFMRQISQLEQEKKELEEKLSRANEIIEQVRQENVTLKNELLTLSDKDKKNLDRLFR
ncbi:MAG: hypothetical protein RQ733_01090 [Methyloprofundus sp.]|nr:hypothetical protein [Methyloprofundus sp.]MDT8424549.1 hypothetical protein [Methyloprofundus sp.]